MKRFRWLLSLSVVFLAAVSVQAQELVTTQRVTLVQERGGRLTNNTKENLSRATKNLSFTGAVFLMPNTLLQVQNRNSFSLREEYRGRNSPTPEQIKRDFEAAYVKVLSGDHEGSEGWMVLSLTSGKEGTVRYVRDAPSNYHQRQTAQQDHAAALEGGVDLQLSVSGGDRRQQMAGKEVYSISVVNVGGVDVRQSFNVTVEVNGRVVKTERIRGLASQRSHYFNAEISESVSRRGGTIVITVDPDGSVQETNRDNNVWKRTLQGR